MVSAKHRGSSLVRDVGNLASDGVMVHVSLMPLDPCSDSDISPHRSDIIGSVQCDALGGQRTATKNGDSKLVLHVCVLVG